MSIVSPMFFAFLLSVLGVYYALPAAWQLWWLLLASYVFYLSYGWHFAAVLLVLTAINFVVARRLRDGETAHRRLLIFALLVNIGSLACLKWVPVLWSRNPAGVVSSSGGGPLELLLPVGLSFWILQAISYQVDVYRGQMVAEDDFVVFALYLAYFPKVLAGPIERARTFLPQLRASRTIDEETVTQGFTLILVGLVRKLVIADQVASMIPAHAFQAPFKESSLLLSLVADAFALYNDFAGYTSIVRGASALLGIDLSVNFAAPFFARNFTELWTRWHITLSSWLRDYIFLPLSRRFVRRNPKVTNVANLTIPTLAAMCASGLWHGASLHMVMWGGLHGLCLIGERVARLFRPLVPMDRRSVVYRAAAGFGVFATFMILYPFFRMSVPDVLAFWRAVYSTGSRAWPEPRVLILISVGLWLDWVQWRNRDELVFLRWPLVPRAALLAAAVIALVVVSPGNAGAPFVYEAF